MASSPREMDAVMPEETEPILEDWCHTKLDIKAFKYTWTIHSFSCRSEANGQYVESSIFPATDVPKWSIRAYPRGRFENYKEYFALDVVSHSDANVNAKFKISILNNKKEKFKTVESRTCPFKQGECSYFKDFITRHSLLNKAADLLPQDTLTLVCEVSVVKESVNVSGVHDFNVVHNSLSGDLGHLLANEQLSDVRLVANGYELKAHKAILAARSEVFAAMFVHDTTERKTSRVNIPDVHHEVLEEMLRFMYTDKAPNLGAMAGELMVASDKYDMKNLKIMCEKSLRRNISIENAAYTLILADRHNAEQLKSETIDFIIMNASCIVETQGWKDMIKTHPSLIAEAFSAIAAKRVITSSGPPSKKIKSYFDK